MLFGIPRAQAQASQAEHSILTGVTPTLESAPATVDLGILCQLDADLIGAGYSTTATNISQQRAAGVLYAGVPFYRSFALELGVADLGLYPVKISTYSNNIPQLAQSIVHDLSPAGRGLTLGVAAPLNLCDRLAGTATAARGTRLRVDAATLRPSGTVAHERHGGGLDGGRCCSRARVKLAFGVGVDCSIPARAVMCCCTRPSWSITLGTDRCRH